jgi:hypothetical protein
MDFAEQERKPKKTVAPTHQSPSAEGSEETPLPPGNGVDYSKAYKFNQNKLLFGDIPAHLQRDVSTASGSGSAQIPTSGRSPYPPTTPGNGVDYSKAYKFNQNKTLFGDIPPHLQRNVATPSSSSSSQGTEAPMLTARGERTEPAHPSASASLIAQTPTAQNPKGSNAGTQSPRLTPGQSIATWGQLNRPLIVQPQIERTFKTASGAAAYAQSLGQAAVVTKQGDHYVINPLTDDPKFPKGRFSFRREGLEDQKYPDLGIAKLRDLTPGLSAIVTQDGYQIRQQEFVNQPMALGTDGKPTPRGKPYNTNEPAFYADTLGLNYAGQREAFGPGLSNIKDKEQFLRQYKLNLRDTALSALKTSEREARQKQQMFAKGMPATEAPKVTKVSKKLETLDQQISKAKLEIIGIEEVQKTPFSGVFADKRYSPEALEQTRAKLQQLELQHRVALAQYPLLSRVDPAEFNKLSPADQAKSLYKASGGVLNDIKTTRENISKDRLNLWQLAPLVSATTNGLGVQPEQMEWVAEKIKSDKTWDIASKVGMGVLSIGLAIGGAALGGPVGAAMAWGAFGIGVGGAISDTQQYFTNQAAANTNLDPNKSVVPQDMKGHWGWVAASWVGAGLDLGTAVQATRLLKAGMEVDQVIRLLSTQNKNLSATELKAAYTTLEKNSSDPRTLKKVLQSAMPEELAAKAGSLIKTPRVLEPAEFAQKFGSQSADAVTTFTKGKDGVTRAEVFFRKGGNPLSMREEAVHISQLAEGRDTAKKIGKLTEENLAKWPKMSTEQRLDLYKAKVEVEIDAQQRLLQQFKDGDPRYVRNVQRNLDNLKARQAQVEAGIKNPKSVEGADWLKENQAPRLFAKERRRGIKNTGEGPLYGKDNPRPGVNYNKPPQEIQKIIESQKGAPDLLTKGIHFTNGRHEFAVTIEDGKLTVKDLVFRSLKQLKGKELATAESEMKQLQSALEYTTLRKKAFDQSRMGLEHAKNRLNQLWEISKKKKLTPGQEAEKINARTRIKEFKVIQKYLSEEFE